MKVNEHVQTVLLAPGSAILQITETAFDFIALFIFQDIVVHGNPDMVEAQTGYIGDVLFRDECIEMLNVIFCELRDPTAQVDPLLESFETLHFYTPRM